MCGKLPLLDQFFIAREAGNTNHGLNTFIQCCQPPGAGASHAHAFNANSFSVDFWPGDQVIKCDLFIPELHSPKRATKPDVNFK
jgi:hypothetical protein